MDAYIVEVREASAPGSEPEVYEIDSPSPEQACYTAKDWYINDCHAHDIEPEKGLVAVARLKDDAS